jgi:hemin uptake protein HemP
MRTIIVRKMSATDPRSPASGVAPVRIPQKVQSKDLVGPGRELVILHNGREYRLRLTQNDKLILTA